jgi:hypothetical protein
MANDIDNIFAARRPDNRGAKRALSKNSAGSGSKDISLVNETKTIPGKLSKTQKKGRVEGTSNNPFGHSDKKNDYDFTDEGWKVYTPEELNVGKGGDTADCPFDCNCCF